MDVMNYVDLTMLKVGCNEDDIHKLIRKAHQNNCASVCIPPCYVKSAKEFCRTFAPVKICTVIGFPNGYNSTEMKIQETKDALSHGADEIDMVANIGWELMATTDELAVERLKNEISQVREICDMYSSADRKVILKVIVESAMLNKETIRKMCEIVYEAGADFIKTSTGFAKEGGASIWTVDIMTKTIKDINFRNNLSSEEGLKIKASGGIRTIEDAKMYIETYGVSRIGASNLT